MVQPQFRPLAVALIRRTVLVATICAVCVAAVQAIVTYRQARERFALSMRDIARTGVPVLSASLWDIEPEIVRRQVTAFADRYQIGYVRVESRTGQVFEAGKLAVREAGASEHFDIPYPYQKT